MTRFNPFVALLYLMILIFAIVVTLLEDLLAYLGRLIKRIRKNFRYVMHNSNPRI